jgi:hypothetical protein
MKPRAPRERLVIDLNTFQIWEGLREDPGSFGGESITATAIGDAPERRITLEHLGTWMPWVNLYAAIATDNGHHEAWDNWPPRDPVVEKDGLRHMTRAEAVEWERLKGEERRKRRLLRARVRTLRTMGVWGVEV